MATTIGPPLDRQTALSYRFRTALTLGTCLIAAGCGLPKPPDMRAEFSKSVQALGVLPVYPLQEDMRVGQIWIEDASANRSDIGIPPGVPTSMRISDDLVEPMEKMRVSLMSKPPRFEKPAATFVDDVFGKGAAPPYFKQGDKDTLALAAMPKYSLASVDQTSFAGAASTVFANFFGSFSFSQSKYLTVEAIGVGNNPRLAAGAARRAKPTGRGRARECRCETNRASSRNLEATRRHQGKLARQCECQPVAGVDAGHRDLYRNGSTV